MLFGVGNAEGEADCYAKKEFFGVEGISSSNFFGTCNGTIEGIKIF